MSEHRNKRMFYHAGQQDNSFDVYDQNTIMFEAMKYINREGLLGYELKSCENYRDHTSALTNMYVLDIVTVKSEKGGG